MWRPLRFLRGYRRIRFFSSNPERILEYTLKQNLPVWNIEGKEGEISFCITLYHWKYLRPFLEKRRQGEEYEEEEEGLPAQMKRIGPRWGFFGGALLFFILLFFLSGFVWSVDVVGNQWIGENEIRECLSQMGLKPGARIRSLDAQEISLRFQVEYPQFSFASVNFVGTRALVEVREREQVEKPVPEETTCNQVAKISGKIIRYEVLNGQIQVARQQYVGKGELLISGVVEQKEGTFRLTHATGRVFAETERVFQTTVPYEQRETVLTGREEVKRSYSFLGLNVPFYLEKAPDFDQWESLEKEEAVSFFGNPLPIRRKEVIFAQTEEKIRTVTVDRAKVLAYDKYERYKKEEFSLNTVFLEENVTFSEGPNGIEMRVEIRAEEDICKEIPFDCSSLY